MFKLTIMFDTYIARSICCHILQNMHPLEKKICFCVIQNHQFQEVFVIYCCPLHSCLNALRYSINRIKRECIDKAMALA